MRKEHTGESCRTMILCVDSYEQGIPTGHFHNPGCGRTCVFHSMTHFLKEMDRLLDDMALPQSFTETRRFSSDGDRDCGPWSRERLLRGGMATFSVRILFRQNASWQGSIKWMEGGREERFRSVLELILLLDDALSSAAVEKAV